MLKNPHYVYGPLDTDIPVKINFADYILNKIVEHKDNVALINGATHEIAKYGDIAQQAVNFAISLTRLGVKKGDVVALCSENRQEFWAAVVGTICTGAIFTPLNVMYSEGEMKHVLSISKPKYLICSQYFYKPMEKIFKSHKYFKKIILFGNEKFGDTLLYNDLAFASPSNATGLRDNVKFEDFEVVDVQGQTDTLFILYSSGTTGLPKGVMITHLNVLASLCSPMFTMPGLEDILIPLTIAPWFHAMGLMGGLGILTTGRKQIYLPKFELNLYLDTIEKYKITQLIVVPPVLAAIINSDTNHDLSSVFIIFCGAAPLSKETIEALKKRIPNVNTVFQGYGLTESTLAVTKDTADTEIAKPGGVGVVVAATTVKVVDIETRKLLGPNQPGEICLKGPAVMKGYIGKDRKDDFDEDGFFKTGDIGYYDDDQYFFIVDRIKELIKYKAIQVAPVEIETVLMQHEAVQDVGVVGIENKAAGEVPLAFVVLQPGKTATEAELKEFVAKRLSNPKHLRGGVRFLEAIPRNQSGKMLRRELRKLAKSSKSKL